jgi:hypothetical protein
MSSRVTEVWRRRRREEEEDSSKEEKKEEKDNNDTFVYGGVFPANLDVEMMDEMRLTCSTDLSSATTPPLRMMSRHKGASTSATVMESVYLQFYTKRKMFSTRHSFSMRAARDALSQTETLRSA